MSSSSNLSPAVSESGNGWILLDGHHHLSDAQWRMLVDSAELVETERVEKSDAGGESEYAARVGRIILDGPTPTGDHANVQGRTPFYQAHTQVLQASLSDSVRGVLREVFGVARPEVARSQYNFLESGDHIGFHSDRMDGIPYAATMVVGLNNQFEGGALQVIDRRGGLIKKTIRQRDIVIFDSSLSHAVTPVTGGLRKSLCVFVADQGRSASS